MAKQYLINLLIKGLPEDIEFEVRESEWSRIQAAFDGAELFYEESRFLLFDTLEGLSVGVSIKDVQAIRFLWNPVDFPSDQKRKEDSVHVWIRGRETPISADTDENKESLFAFFVCLESGAESVRFPSFDDEDGEIFQVNASEVVLVTAPLHEINEGSREMQADNDDDDSIYF